YADHRPRISSSLLPAQAQIKQCDTPNSWARERCDCQNTERASRRRLTSATCTSDNLRLLIKHQLLRVSPQFGAKLVHDLKACFRADSRVCPQSPQNLKR